MQVLLLVWATPADGAPAYTDGDVLRDIVVACRADAGVGLRHDSGRVHAQVDTRPVAGFLPGLCAPRSQQPLRPSLSRPMRPGALDTLSPAGAPRQACCREKP